MTKSGKHCGKRRNVFKKLCAAEASESVYMRERVNISHIQMISDISAGDNLKTWWQKEKFFMMNNFSFCHNVFNYIQYFHII